MELYRERDPFPYRYNFDEDLEYFDMYYRDGYCFDLYYIPPSKKITRIRVEKTIKEEEQI